jgi:hypothetical protein
MKFGVQKLSQCARLYQSPSTRGWPPEAPKMQGFQLLKRSSDQTRSNIPSKSKASASSWSKNWPSGDDKLPTDPDAHKRNDSNQRADGTFQSSDRMQIPVTNATWCSLMDSNHQLTD